MKHEIKKSSDLKEMREKTGLTIATMAGLIGVSPSTLRRYEQENVNVPEVIAKSVEEIRDIISADSVNKAGERIRCFRESIGLSCTEFAEEAGIHRSNIYEIENGTQKLTERTAKLIEDRFDIGKEWLLYGLETEKDFPLSDKLISWIKSNPQLRRDLWIRMREDYKK